MKKVKKKEKSGFIKSYWNGEESLGFSFWAISVLGLTVLSIPMIVIETQGDVFTIRFQILELYCSLLM